MGFFARLWNGVKFAIGWGIPLTIGLGWWCQMNTFSYIPFPQGFIAGIFVSSFLVPPACFFIGFVRYKKKSARPPQLVRGKLIEPRPCPSCGNVNRLGDRFCRKCGTPLPTVPTEEKAYCTKCGTELKKGAKFCHKCRQAVTRITPPREEIPAVEKVLGAIKVAKGANYFGLYFTTNRVIVAKTGGGGWGWLFGGIGTIVGAIATGKRAEKRFKELSKLSPESILMADKKNFGIPYHDITQVEVKKHMIYILTRRKKHKFGMLGRKKQLDDYANLIRSILPNKTYVS